MGEYDFWLKRTKDSVNVVANREWVKQHLGICNLEGLIKTLEFKISLLEKPHRKQKILELLGKDGHPRNIRWLQFRMEEVRYQDIHELLEEGKLAFEWHGPHRMYSLKEGVAT